MKALTFRPLRFVKKLDKIVVASYAQWNRVRTADYNKFNLVINDEYRKMPNDAIVYNYAGEELFWRDFDPSEIPVFTHPFIAPNLSYIHENYPRHGIKWDPFGPVSYNARGMDCQGTPTFSHGTINHIVNNTRTLGAVDEYDLLTVGVVKKWYGWFLLNLQNSTITVK